MVIRPTDEHNATFAQLFEGIAQSVERAIQGKPEVIRLMILCLLAEGHVLIEDAPGVGKTSMAKALARSIDTEFGRIQFTPDLLPGDVLGVSVWDRSSSTFEFRRGPIFAGIVLADEINRASPKTQAALLESMAERQVTVDGTTYPLQRPFMVIATQNPIEHEGTYPLPESQLDRFLVRSSIGYPSREAELDILDSHSKAEPVDDIGPVVTGRQIQQLSAACMSVYVAPGIKRYLVDLADASRHHPQIALGMSPRATLSLQSIARARAAAAGRDYVLPDDVKALAPSVLSHRLILKPDAQLRGGTTRAVVDDLLTTVPVPADPRR